MCILLHVYIYIHVIFIKNPRTNIYIYIYIIYIYICTSTFACTVCMFICKKKAGHVHFVWWYLCKTLSPNRVLFFGTAGGCLEVHIASWHQYISSKLA